MNDHTRGSSARDQRGFSLVELVIAVLILTIGLLALAGTSGFAVRAITLADVQTERAAAIQSVLERLRAIDFDDVDSGSATVGRYTAEWISDRLSSTAKEIELVTIGPGLRQNAAQSVMPALDPQAHDTVTYLIMRP